MTKKEIKTSPGMSMEYFLEVYYGVDEEIASKISLHSHKSIGKIARLYGVKLSKLGFDNVSREMIARGEVILVEDHFRNAAPYINPNIKLTDEFETTMDERFVSHEVYEEEEEYDKHKGRQKIKHFKS